MSPVCLQPLQPIEGQVADGWESNSMKLSTTATVQRWPGDHPELSGVGHNG